MSTSDFTCPHCRYPAPLSAFENVGGGKLKCKRCRSLFEDPNAFEATLSYADCDSLRPVTRFPFSLNGNNTMIRVRDGYLALIVGTGGIRLWLEADNCLITDLPEGFQLYYVCLTPRIMWGAGVQERYGAYGWAQLSVSREYVKEFAGMDARIIMLEKHLQVIVNRCVAGFIETEIRQNNGGLLEHRDRYQNMLGEMEKGVSLTRIDPMGFRSGDNVTHFFSSYPSQNEMCEAVELFPTYQPPVEIIKTPRKTYIVSDGVEEVLIRSASKADRHKAGEKLDSKVLRGAEKLMRYRKKEFDYPFGWGIFNQPKPVSGYYSAQGTISFFIDSTERFSLLLAKTRSWQEFENKLFNDVIKKELSAALRDVLGVRISRKGFHEDQIEGSLSAMSVELTNLLNGEGLSAKGPAFANYGLRVKQTDILGIHFYSTRR